MAKEKNSITTPEFRGSYCNLVTPRAIDEGGDKKYSMLIVLPKEEKTTAIFLKKLEKMIADASMAKFGKVLPKGALKHYPIRDGDDSENEQFHGHFLITCSNKFKPGCIDKNGNKLIAEDELYSGAWYRASVDAWAWSGPKFGKGVSINLNNVLKVKDDDAFGGGRRAEEDFKEFLEEGADEEGGEDEADEAMLG